MIGGPISVANSNLAFAVAGRRLAPYRIRCRRGARLPDVHPRLFAIFFANHPIPWISA